MFCIVLYRNHVLTYLEFQETRRTRNVKTVDVGRNLVHRTRVQANLGKYQWSIIPGITETKVKKKGKIKTQAPSLLQTDIASLPVVGSLKTKATLLMGLGRYPWQRHKRLVMGQSNRVHMLELPGTWWLSKAEAKSGIRDPFTKRMVESSGQKDGTIERKVPYVTDLHVQQPPGI
jgi:hypothetical protein